MMKVKEGVFLQRFSGPIAAIIFVALDLLHVQSVVPEWERKYIQYTRLKALIFGIPQAQCLRY